MKPKTHPDCEVRSEYWTGTTLLTLAMEHARRLGIPYCVLDATAESVNFYRRFFDFKDGVREGKYYPMCMSLNDWRPELTLSKARVIPQRYVMRLEVQDNDLNENENNEMDEERTITFKFQQGENGNVENVEMRTMNTKSGTCKGFETMTMMRSPKDSVWYEISKLQKELLSVESRNKLYRDRAQSRMQVWQNKTMLTLTKTEMERIEAWKHVPKKMVQSEEKEEEEKKEEEKEIVEEKKQEKEEELYCVCRTPWNDQDPSAEPMYNCEHCDGWFHLRCLGLRECKEELFAGRCVVDKKGIHWDVEKCFLCNECQKKTGRKLPRREHQHQHQKTKRKRVRKRKSENEFISTPKQYILSNSPRTTSSSGRSVRKVNYSAMLAGNYVETNYENSVERTPSSSSSPTPTPPQEVVSNEKTMTPKSDNVDTTSPPPQPQQATTPTLSPRRESRGSVLQDKVNTQRDKSKVQVSAFALLAKGQRAFWKSSGDKKKRKRGNKSGKKCSLLKLYYLNFLL